MISAIIVENGASKDELERSVLALSNAGITDNILVGTQRPAQPHQVSSVILVDKIWLASCLRQATLIAKGETIIFVDARSPLSREQIELAIGGFKSKKGAVMAYAPVLFADETVDFEDVAADQLVKVLQHTERWPFQLVAARSSFLKSLGELQGESLNEIMATAMMRAVAGGELVERLPLTITLAANTHNAQTLALSAMARARTLKVLISHSNIEELFPQHDWGVHQGESAAAAYHTLAALFIRFGDTTSAIECLDLSDQLEDSPRSLALKGFIAMTRGEMLGAVANMVSSLQQYELRKAENEGHYMTFQPNNLEAINSSLRAGLEALNSKNNERALECFTQAVFGFDPLFQQIGLAVGKSDAVN